VTRCVAAVLGLALLLPIVAAAAPDFSALDVTP